MCKPYIFKVGDKGTTRIGTRYEVVGVYQEKVVTINPDTRTLYLTEKDGEYAGKQYLLKPERFAYVNVYADRHGIQHSAAHATEERARESVSENGGRMYHVIALPVKLQY